MKRPASNLLIATLAVGGTLYLSAASNDAPEPTDSGSVKHVLVAQVSASRETRALRFSGVLRAEHRARLPFTIRGRLIERPVEIGDHVPRGATLARLDARKLRNRRDAAEAALAELGARRAQRERDRARVERLVRAKAATDEELEQLGAALDAIRAGEAAATAEAHEAERLLGDAVLSAPFAGTVTEVLAEPGEFVEAGRPVIVLAGDGGLEVEVEVPEATIVRLAEGDAVEIFLRALGETVDGRIDSVGRTAAGPGRLFPVVVALDAARMNDSRAAAGMTAEAVLRWADDDALALPVEAVVDPGGRRPVVFRVRDHDGAAIAERIEVSIGTLLGDRVTVHGALAAGDRVVVGGQRGLLDGDRVEVEESTP